MSTRNNSWGKGGRCVGLATLPPSCADCLEICAPQTPVTLWAFQACNGIALPFYTPCTMGVNYRRLLRRNKSTYSFRETKIFEESRRVPPFINFLFPPHLWCFVPIPGHGIPYGASRSDSLDPPSSVGPFWTSDQPNAETSTWQHTTLTMDKHPCPRRDSNPQAQQESDRRPTPSTARPLGPAFRLIQNENLRSG